MNPQPHHSLHLLALTYELDQLQPPGAQAFPYPAWHQPADEIQARVQQAHAYALGTEPQSAQDSGLLRPVLAALANAPTQAHFPPTTLSRDQGALPITQPHTPIDRARLWKDLCTNAKGLPAESPDTYLTHLRPLLETFLSNLAHRQGPADISLWARAHTRTAIALATADQPLRTPWQLTLIGGELSGIQTFLYDIGSTMAAKLLKGRSFYVHLLIDTIKQFLQRELNLSEAQTLIDTGGKLILLAGADLSTRLPACQQTLEQKIWNHHRHQLSFHLASHHFDAPLLAQPQGLQHIIADLETKLRTTRRQPYHNLLNQNPPALFQPRCQGGLTRRDDLTGEELTPQEADTIRDLKMDEAEKQAFRISEATWIQLGLGKRLKGAGKWLSSHTDLRHDPQWITPADLGISHYLVNEKSDNTPNPDLLTRTLLLNPEKPKDQAFIWLAGITFPTDDQGDILTFDKLCGPEPDEKEAEGDQTSKLNRLGHLRMDVDSLGEGIKNNLTSLARYLAISRSLDHFFKGHLEHIRSKKAYKDCCVLIYAGGDDLYAVGPWHTITDFAKEVRESFSKWCGTDQVGISAGIYLTGITHPLAHAATQAGKAESQAKKHTYKDKPKNSLSILGRSFQWGEELKAILSLRDQLIQHIQSEALNTGFLHKLIRHRIDCETQQDLPADAPRRWQFNAAWDLVRYQENLQKTAQDDRSKQDALAFLKDHVLKLYNQTGKDIQTQVVQLGVAARWAELVLRSVEPTKI